MNHNKPIRILFLIDELLKGGTENQLIWLVENLPRDKFDPYLYVIRGNEYSDSLCLSTPLITLGKSHFPLWKNILLIRKLSREIYTHKFDIVQTQFQESEIYGVLAARFSHHRPILISTRRNLYHWCNEKPWIFMTTKMLVKYVNIVLANSYAARDLCQKLEKVPKDKIIVIQNAVDISLFNEIGKNEAKTQFGFDLGDVVIGVVGNWRPVKGLKVFIEAASLVAKKYANVHFVLVGRGPMEDIIRAEIQKHDLPKVTLMGNNTHIPSIMAAFDIAVQPSLSESFSNVLIEYLAAKRPVVATRVGDAERVIDHDVDGILVKPGNAFELASGIMELISNYEKAESMAMHGYLKVRAHWDQQNVLEKYLKLYPRLCTRFIEPMC